MTPPDLATQFATDFRKHKKTRSRKSVPTDVIIPELIDWLLQHDLGATACCKDGRINIFFSDGSEIATQFLVPGCPDQPWNWRRDLDDFVARMIAEGKIEAGMSVRVWYRNLKPLTRSQASRRSCGRDKSEPRGG